MWVGAVGGPRWWRRRDTTKFVLLLAVGLLVAGCSQSPSGTKNGGSSSTSTTGGHQSSGTTTTTTPPPVAADVVAAGPSVPWAEVGSGWLLATWSSQVTFVTGQGSGSATLFLVDPAGGRYDLGSAPSSRLVDWSGNGDDALFLVPPASGTLSQSQIVVEDLRTRSERNIEAPTGATVFAARFSKPEGTAVLVPGAPAHRYGLSGTLEETYPSSIPGQGTASKAESTLAEAPDGTELVLQATGGLDVVTNEGAPVRFLAPPSGQRTCLLDGWWGQNDVLETCANELFAQPAAGGSSAMIAASTTGGEYIDAWTVGGKVVAEAGACGTTWLVTVGTTGSTQRITIPGAGSVVGIGVAGDQLAVLVTPSCDEPAGKPRTGNLLEWYAPSSNALHTVLGGTFGGGTVDAAVSEDHA